jgi:hypothetical protein
MCRTVLIATFLSFLAGHVGSARAWWDAGHMQIAYVAYKHLDRPVREKVDARVSNRTSKTLKRASDYLR